MTMGSKKFYETVFNGVAPLLRLSLQSHRLGLGDSFYDIKVLRLFVKDGQSDWERNKLGLVMFFCFLPIWNECANDIYTFRLQLPLQHRGNGPPRSLAHPHSPFFLSHQWQFPASRTALHQRHCPFGIDATNITTTTITTISTNWAPIIPLDSCWHCLFLPHPMWKQRQMSW